MQVAAWDPIAAGLTDMVMRKTRVLLGVVLIGALACAAMARQGAVTRGLPCSAFAKNGEGDWVSVRDVRLRGPDGSVQIKAGAAMLDELQEHLDLRCH